jgi:hypothetical protein
MIPDESSAHCSRACRSDRQPRVLELLLWQRRRLIQDPFIMQYSISDLDTVPGFHERHGFATFRH